MFFTLDNFYTSDTWIKFRTQLMLERVNADGFLICAHCGKPILKKYDCIAHHKTELTAENVNDYNISLNPENVELIHHRCHNIEHERFEGFRQRVWLVYGSPCAGKSTWVHNNARCDDLILDLDELWCAVCLSDKYHKPKALKTNVFLLRDCILDQIKCRVGRWRNAYIIGGYPLRSDRDRLCDQLRAEPLFIDTPQDVCLDRARSDDWREYINNWFDNYTP